MNFLHSNKDFVGHLCMDDVFIDICQSPANIDLNSKNLVTSINLPDQQLINIIFVCLFIFFFVSCNTWYTRLQMTAYDLVCSTISFLYLNSQARWENLINFSKPPTLSNKHANRK